MVEQLCPTCRCSVVEGHEKEGVMYCCVPGNNVSAAAVKPWKKRRRTEITRVNHLRAWLSSGIIR